LSLESNDVDSLRIEIIGVPGIPEVKPGDDIGELIVRATEKAGLAILDGDIIVVTQKIVSKSEGRLLKLSEVRPSEFAYHIAQELGKPPEEVEVVLRESRTIIRARKSKGLLIK